MSGTPSQGLFYGIEVKIDKKGYFGVPRCLEITQFLRDTAVRSKAAFLTGLVTLPTPPK
jgi:hypothetical protein